MRFNSFKKQSELIEQRLTTIASQVSTLAKVESLSEQQINKLKLLSQTATQKYHEYDRIVNKLFGTSPLPDDIEDKVIAKLQDSISDLYITITSTCGTLIPEEPHNESNSSNQSQQPTAAPQPTVNLPRLNLPTFAGQPDRWIAFHSLFENTIHKNESISNVEKFTYLLSCLSDEPLGLVKSLPVTNANYLIAWQTLIKRYHKSRVLISLHINNLLDLSVTSNPTVKQLRQFVSSFNENSQALLALGHDITQESLILTTHLLRKFNPDLRSKFEHSRTNSNDTPKIDEFIGFLDNECTQLEAANVLHVSHNSSSHEMSSFRKSNAYPNKQFSSKQNHKVVLSSSNQQLTCIYCSSSEHNIYKCSAFSSLDVMARVAFIKDKSLCQNCFGNHKTNACKSLRNCSTCNRRHHSMIHVNAWSQPNTNKKGCVSTNPSPATIPSSSESKVALSSSLSTNCKQNTTVLLATALVAISTPDNNNKLVVRAILDSASQSTIITEHCARVLRLPRSNVDTSLLNGLAATKVNTKGLSFINITSLSGTPVASSQPVTILNKITSDLPKIKISPSVKDQLKNFVLADPTFDTPAPIDLLIGGDLFSLCLKGLPVSLGDGMPQAMKTVFGFVIMGTAPTIDPQQSENNLVTLLSVNDLDIHASMQQFWCIEEPPQNIKLSPEDQQCEEHFLKTHSRNETGRYECRLPFKSDPTQLGDSSQIAKSMFLSLEKKFEKNPGFRNMYVEFMADYLNSGHMQLCSTPSSKPFYIIPHHGVFKENKIRVVFNASAPTSSGISLNNLLHQGPKLHNEIPDIILKFRLHKFVFTCDIKQMFRQISIQEDDQRYQLIYWREDPSLPIQLYQLTTVTYGMTSSPYLANRVVQQLIADEGHNHPMAAQALQRQLFVDDALLGSNSEDEALQLKDDVIQLLKKGGFELRKWVSNSDKLISHVPEDHQEKPLYFLTPEQPCFSVLGLKWIPKEDIFSYVINVPQGEVTKRSVLSCIAKIYDPCGWLTPVTVWAKILMQHLWTLGLTWNDPLPEIIHNKWILFVTQLPSLENIKISRHLGLSESSNLQLHGFADASETAYAACVYLRQVQSDNNATVKLLIAKSRVAPLKRVTLPRLELCAALLLAKLLNYISTQLSTSVNISSMHAWSDSTITLGWIHTPAYRLKVFVANRVAEIQDLTPPSIWAHVGSHFNSADVSSRGILPQELKTHPLWWEGPSWLKLPPKMWPISPLIINEEDVLPEIKPETFHTLVSVENGLPDLLSRFSSWIKLLNVTAYVLRFIHCLKNKLKITGPLRLHEIDTAINRVCWLVQQDAFQEEIVHLQKKKNCSQRIQRLRPFLDEDSVLRVGGRLKNSNLSLSAKNPILLPKKHHVVDLIIDYYHKHHLHVGPQALQAILSQQFWILSARSVIRSRIFRCFQCFKARPTMETPLMGDLPSSRVNPGRVFATSGTDFAGPFKIKLHTLRRVQPVKVYLCVFICFATKAVHLEVATDLTADAFIAALTRFVSRRGLVSHLYCDCGTNFVGAAATLQKCFKDLLKTPSLQSFALQNKINFHFLPPYAPHQGGLWERAVRSAKHHLQRVIGTQLLTYEEFITLTARVEAILNSRPLVPLSADPNDLEPLTPGHFIAGGPLTSVIEPELTEYSSNRLRRWQLVQSFSQHLWQRWQREYLHTLQQRSKWTTPGNNITIGDLVILHEPNTPPLSWKLGRITGVNPGADGVVRVVNVKTATGNFRRPAVKVSRLPTQ